MPSFIETFYERLDEKLGDPALSRRYPKDRKLRDLHDADQVLFESILQATGQEGSAGRAETTITLTDGQPFYTLPGNFRQFIRFEHRLDGDRNMIDARMRSIPMFDDGPGIEILGAERGAIIRPNPVLTEDQDWTLIYERGPVLLHYAKAASVGEQSLTLGVPPANGGEVVRIDDYYNNVLLRVYQASSGAHQTVEVADYAADSNTCALRHAWTVKPTGEVWYEVRPTLPHNYDVAYALYVAAQKCTTRRQADLKRELLVDYRRVWSACLAYFNSNVADRGPSRMQAYPGDDIDPYDQA